MTASATRCPRGSSGYTEDATIRCERTVLRPMSTNDASSLRTAVSEPPGKGVHHGSQGACARSCSTVSTLRRWRDFGRPALGYAVREYDDAELERLRAQGIVDPEDDPSVVIDPLDHGPSVWFNRVPEAKAVKNRVHLDVDLDDEADIDRLVAGGARVSRPLGAVPDEMWAILVDPEGNEFCAFPPE